MRKKIYGNTIKQAMRKHIGARRRFLTFSLCLCMIGAELPLTTAANTAKNENGGVVSEISGKLLGAAGAWDGTVASAFAGGNGTASSPYEIATAEQLAYLEQQVNGGTAASDIYYKLTEDIDLGNNSWTPIGNSLEHAFQGHFDGGSHSITFSGQILSVEAAATGNDHIAAGLFGYAKGAAIQKLTVKGTITAGTDLTKYTLYAGTLCGYAEACTISDCVNAAAVTVTASGSHTIYGGGIIGRVGGTQQTTIIACSNTGAIAVKGESYGCGGGICAVTYGDSGESNVRILACQNSGAVTMTIGEDPTASYACAGGIAGECRGTVIACLNTGAVTATATTGTTGAGTAFAGGIVGKQNAGTVTSCLNTAALSATGQAAGNIGADKNGRVGGIGATAEDGVTVNACYYNSSVALTGNTTWAVSKGVMGLAATADEIKQGGIAYQMNVALETAQETDYQWGQKLDSNNNTQNNDEHPVPETVIDHTDRKVYASTPCPSFWTNDSSYDGLQHGGRGICFTEDENYPNRLNAHCICGEDVGYVYLVTDAKPLVYDGSVGADKGMNVTVSTAELHVENQNFDQSYGTTTYPVSYYRCNGADETYLGTGKTFDAGTFVARWTPTGTDGITAACSLTYTVAPANLTVSGVTVKDKVYDGTNVVEIESVTLDGICTKDDVKVDTTGLTGTLDSDAAGTYTSVTLPQTLTLTGDKASNYTLTQPTAAVSTTAEIQKKAALSFSTTRSYKKSDTSVTFDPTTFFPSDCGGVTKVTATAGGCLSGQTVTVNQDRTISFTPKSPDATTAGSITLTVSTANYEDSTVTLTVNLLDTEPIGVTPVTSGVTDTAATVKLTADQTAGGYELLYVTAQRTDTDPDVLFTQTNAGYMSNTTGTFSLSGLTAETTYYVYCAAKDADGNYGNVVMTTFTTTATPAPGGSTSGGSNNTGNTSGSSNTSGGSYGGGSASTDTKTEDTSKSESETTKTETKEDGSTVTTTKTTNADGSTTTKTETVYADGSTKTKTVIQDGNTKVTVTVAADADGKVTDISVSVKQVSDEKGASLSADTLNKATDAAGTTDVEITTKIVDSDGNTRYRLTVNAADLQAGETLKVLKVDKATGELVLVNASEYVVDENGNIVFDDLKKGSYQVVTEKDAKVHSKRVLKTVQLKQKTKTVKAGKKTTCKLSDALNMNNVKKVTYKSTKKSVATVNKNGKVTAKKSGKTTIQVTVTLNNGEIKTVKVVITVKAAKK